MAGFPVRVEQLLLQQMRPHLLQPSRFNVGNATAKQSRGLDQLGADQPFARFFSQVHTGVAMEPDAARTEVNVLFVLLPTDVAQQATQHGQVQVLVAGRLLVDLPALLFHHGEELAVHIAPFAPSADVDVVLPQQVVVLAVAEFVVGTVSSARGLQPIPQTQIAAELALVILELGVRLIGLGLRLQGTVAHVLNTQRRRDDQHLVQTLAFTRRQNHPAHTRVERQLGQRLPNGREAVVVQHRAEFIQQLKTIRDGLGAWRFQEWEIDHIAQVQRHHAQNHTGQGAAQYFGFCETGASVEIFLVIKANANAVGHTAASPCTLVGGGLADRLHQKLLHLASEAVALDPGQAIVHHIANTRHREGCFGHVGGQHDARRTACFKHLLLFSLRQPRKQGQHFHLTGVGVVRQVTAQVLGGISNFTLARQKHQDVTPWRAGPKFVHRVRDGMAQVVVAAFLPRAVAHFHGIGASRHHQHRRWAMAAGEMLGKAVGINGGRSDDDLQVGATRQDLLEVAEQKIDVQTALVRLINDDGVIGLQKRVGLGLGQQNPIGHELY